MTTDAAVIELRTHLREEIPEFIEADYPDYVVDRWIGVAREIHNLSTRATLYLTAHFLASYATDPAARDVVSVQDGGVRQIKRIEEGPRETEYFPTASTNSEESRYAEEDYDQTEYGRIFVALEKRATSFSARVYG